jgi:hypothetical protein
MRSTQQPYRDSQSRARHGTHRLTRLHWSQQSQQFHDIVGIIVGGIRRIPARRTRRALDPCRARGHLEIDKALIKGFQRAELPCDHQRRVAWQHDTARCDADGVLGPAGDIADHPAVAALAIPGILGCSASQYRS